jgi:hypothetical protein
MLNFGVAPVAKWIETKERRPANRQSVTWRVSGDRDVDGWYIDGLWYFADKSMYVYYVPRYWRERIVNESPLT